AASGAGSGRRSAPDARPLARAGSASPLGRAAGRPRRGARRVGGDRGAGVEATTPHVPLAARGRRGFRGGGGRGAAGGGGRGPGGGVVVAAGRGLEPALARGPGAAAGRPAAGRHAAVEPGPA